MKNQLIYSMENQPTTYISFSADINPTTTETLINVMAQQANAGVKHVYLLLSSSGGSVMNGMTLYNVLRSMPFDLTVHNVGNIESIAIAVFLAGKTRYACPNSTFMFHGVGFDIAGGIRLEEKFLRERLSGITSDHKRIASVISERTSLTTSKIADFFREGSTTDTTFALESGIIQEIRDVQIPTGSPILSLVFPR